MKSLSVTARRVTTAVLFVMIAFAGTASAQCISTTCGGGQTFIDQLIVALQALPPNAVIATLIELLVVISVIGILVGL
jgi:prepilin-type N-terminal cleavage/methylation domain-containing protein